MMHPEIFQASWPFYDNTYLGGFEFSPMIELINHSAPISSEPFSPLDSGDIPMSFEAFDPDWSGEFGSFGGFLEESVGSFTSEVFSADESYNQSTKSEASVDATSEREVLILPHDDTEIENELSISHLLSAYGDALEKGHEELGRVIRRRIHEKSSPLGKILERIGFNLSQEVPERESEYLNRESAKNFDAAFEALYLISPYGKFAHFAANSAILEAAPAETETIHVVDFDLGDGLQWAPVIEAAARRKIRLKLTSIKAAEREADHEDEPRQSFKETRRRLLDHARANRVDFTVNESGIEDFVAGFEPGEREFLAFNCVVGLPHMRRVRIRRFVNEFVGLAKELLANSKGILVIGDGDQCERLFKTCPSFGSFFEGLILHYKALLESLDSGFPAHLRQARLAVESLFLGPHISSAGWLERWGEAKSGHPFGSLWAGLTGRELSMQSMIELIEMVRGEGCYGVRIEGVNGNEASLEWNGIPLVRVSAWTYQN